MNSKIKKNGTTKDVLKEFKESTSLTDEEVEDEMYVMLVSRDNDTIKNLKNRFGETANRILKNFDLNKVIKRAEENK